MKSGSRSLAELYDGRAAAFGRDVRASGYFCRQSFDQRYEKITELLRSADQKQILDVGCGPGLFSARLALKNRVVGIDLSHQMLRLAGRDLNAVQGDAFSLPFQNHSFDVVMSIEVLQHLSKPECFLKEMARVTKSGGQMILSSLNDASLLHRLLKPVGGYDSLYFHPLSPIRTIFENEGFKNFETHFLGFPFPWTWNGNGQENWRLPFATSWIIRCMKT